MEYYKQLNSELITQVQELRENVAFYQKELTRITSMLFDEHRMRIEQEQKILTLLTFHFRETIKHFKPDADIIKLLDINHSVKPNDETEHSQSNKRRSSTILSDFRKSLVHQRRRSSMEIVSPIKQNAINKTQMDIDHDFYPSEDSPFRRKESVSDEIVKTKEDIVPRDMQLSIESDDNSSQSTSRNDEDEENDESSTEHMKLSILLESMHEGSEEDALPDETAKTKNNTATSLEVESTFEQTNDENDLTNAFLHKSTSIDNEKSKSPPRLQFVEMRRGKYRQEMTNMYREPNWWNVKPSTPHKDLLRRSCLEDLSNLNISELAMRDHIENAPSSTPNQTLLRQLERNSMHRNSLSSTLVAKTNDTTSTGSPNIIEEAIESIKIESQCSADGTSINSTSLRPNRRCKPSCLVEPNLRRKLRNNETKRKK